MAMAHLVFLLPRATFDWLIEPENFLRVLEGTYR